jgi:nitrate reductase delta subunit
MSHLPKVLDALSKLLSYPDEHTVQTAELLYVLLMDELPEAASKASAFGLFADQHDLHELEETFTRTFDVNPTCALEVGWHLFGEEYARGMFLVRMREELRKYGLPESAELPDHLCHVLAVLAAMPEEEATRFVKPCVQPAVEKMNAALEGKGTPYAHVVSSLSLVLRHAWGEPAETTAESAANGTGAFASDPLRAFPVADVMAGGASSCGEPLDLVPLTIGASLGQGPNAASDIHQALAPTRKP